MKKLTTILERRHRREGFQCGQPDLDRYLLRQAGQDQRRRLTVCFVAADPEDRVWGYYTLSNAGIPAEELPEAFARRLPAGYRSLPFTLLGRLAVDRSRQGRGQGALLLADALHRAFRAAVQTQGSLAVVVDPIDGAAADWYARFGFQRLPDSGRLMLPMATLAELFGTG